MSRGTRRSVAALVVAFAVMMVTSSVAWAAGPKITSFTPATGNTGTRVVITGTGFTGTSGVQFAGVAASSFTVDSPTQITATVASGTTTGKIRVAGPGGAVQSTSLFTIARLPSTSSGFTFTPMSGPVGTAVVITGSGFSGATSVEFGGLSAAYNVDSATQITATVPAKATTGKIRIETASDVFQLTDTFTVTKAAAQTTTFSPSGGVVGSKVVITGAGFLGTTSVEFSGKAATFNVDSPTQITATVPAGAVTGKLRITTPTGAFQTTQTFAVLPAPAPVVIGGDWESTQGQYVLIGSGFTSVTGVTVAGVPVQWFRINNDGNMTFLAAKGTTSGQVVLTIAGGKQFSPSQWAHVPLQFVQTQSNESAYSGERITFTVRLTGVTSMTFGGASATIDSLTPLGDGEYLLTVTVPQGPVYGPVILTSAQGTFTLPAWFKIF